MKKASRPKPKQKSTRKKSPAKSTTQSKTQRLQRVLAHCGYGSRRECEEFIEEGRIEVDGKIVTKLGTKVDPFSQKIYFDGVKLKMPRLKYYALNKPPGIVSTAKDPSGRLRVIDLIKSDQRVYNVGRLDQSSEGLILVTNDGDLANQLTHPRYGVPKKYLVQVQGRPSPEKLRSLVDGVYLAEGKARVSNIKFKRRTKDTSWLEIVLDEGRNREIRRLLARIGHKVLRLRRIGIGPLALGELPLGAHRQLTFEEVAALRKAVESAPKRRRKKKRVLTGEKSSERRALTGGGKAGGKKKKTTKRGTSKFGKKTSGGGRSAARAKTVKPAFKKRRAKGKGKSEEAADTSRSRSKKKTSLKKSATKRTTKRSAKRSVKPSRGKPAKGKGSRTKKRGR